MRYFIALLFLASTCFGAEWYVPESGSIAFSIRDPKAENVSVMDHEETLGLTCPAFSLDVMNERQDGIHYYGYEYEGAYMLDKVDIKLSDQVCTADKISRQTLQWGWWGDNFGAGTGITSHKYTMNHTTGFFSWWLWLPGGGCEFMTNFGSLHVWDIQTTLEYGNRQYRPFLYLRYYRDPPEISRQVKVGLKYYLDGSSND